MKFSHLLRPFLSFRISFLNCAISNFKNVFKRKSCSQKKYVNRATSIALLKSDFFGREGCVMTVIFKYLLLSRIKWCFLFLLELFADYISDERKKEKTTDFPIKWNWTQLMQRDKAREINFMQIVECETQNRWFRHFQMLSKLISFHWLIWQ